MKNGLRPDQSARGGGSRAGLARLRSASAGSHRVLHSARAVRVPNRELNHTKSSGYKLWRKARDEAGVTRLRRTRVFSKAVHRHSGRGVSHKPAHFTATNSPGARKVKFVSRSGSRPLKKVAAGTCTSSC